MLEKKTNSIKKQSQNKKRIATPKRKKRRYRSKPYMVAGGDTEGKVTYTYPTGNSEDY